MVGRSMKRRYTKRRNTKRRNMKRRYTKRRYTKRRTKRRIIKNMKNYRKNTTKKSKLRGGAGRIASGIENFANQHCACLRAALAAAEELRPAGVQMTGTDPSAAEELRPASVQMTGTDPSAAGVQMVRWGKPSTDNKENRDGFEIPTNLINNKEDEPWYFVIPKSLHLIADGLAGEEWRYVENNKGDEIKLIEFILSKSGDYSKEDLEKLPAEIITFSPESDSIAREIKTKLESIVNSKLIPMLEEIDKNFDSKAKIFSDDVDFTHSITSQHGGDKLVIELRFKGPLYNDYIRSFGRNGKMLDNPVTLACIFCSMIRIMVNFIKSDKEYLVWIQQKGNIVDKEKFLQLVEDCKQFDIAWLWQMKDGAFPKRQRPGEDHNLDISGSQTLSRSGLQYITGRQWNDMDGTIYGNVSVMMNKRMANYCINMLLNSDPRSNTPNTDMFKEDVTLQEWAEYRRGVFNVGIVYKQEGHPIQYIDAKSSYKTGGS